MIASNFLFIFDQFFDVFDFGKQLLALSLNKKLLEIILEGYFGTEIKIYGQTKGESFALYKTDQIIQSNNRTTQTKLMGCTQSVKENTVQPIPAPKGAPIDPLNSQGDIIEAITNDPHIHYFQKKIQEVILPARRKKLQEKESGIVQTANTEQSNSNKSNISKQPQNQRTNKITIQTYATTDQKDHEKYVDSVNNALENNQASVTNIMAYMIDEMADLREGRRAHDKYSNDSYAALKCFIYLYTGHYTYKKINSQLRRSDYDKISAVIAVVQKQLQEYNKQKFARKLKANQKYGQFLNLYRGIPKPDKTMMKGKKQFWKGFTSTSLDTTVASRFGRYLFVFNLDKATPHAYMVVPDELSQFKEEEIIIFPYFYFQVTNVQNFTSGARYQCKQAFLE